MGVYWVKSLLMDTSTSALFDSLQAVILWEIVSPIVEPVSPS